jgi:hypothetical protein
VLDGIERSGERGCRDYAVLLLVARLGLRAREVCRLTLDDVRWRGGTLVIRRKGGRAEEFPLLAEVGHALADYLRARPLTAGTRAVFVTAVAPRRAMTRQAVGQIVRTACARGQASRAAPVPASSGRRLAAGRRAASRHRAGAGAPGAGGHRWVRRPWPVTDRGPDPVLAARGAARMSMQEGVGEYLALRRALGYQLKQDGQLLRDFAARLDADGTGY